MKEEDCSHCAASRGVSSLRSEWHASTKCHCDGATATVAISCATFIKLVRHCKNMPKKVCHSRNFLAGIHNWSLYITSRLREKNNISIRSTRQHVQRSTTKKAKSGFLHVFRRNLNERHRYGFPLAREYHNQSEHHPRIFIRKKRRPPAFQAWGRHPGLQ